MLTDAHCHPFDLVRVFPQAEQERRRVGVLAAASACDLEEFTYNEDLARKAAAENAAPLITCFAVHPQFPAGIKASGKKPGDELERGFETLQNLSSAGRIAAVGECGFDLYNSAFRETEPLQEKIFSFHLETALKYNLPLVLHVRRAMHKIFAAAKALSKYRAVIFHSWPGTFEEGQSLLRRGVNAYFSFGSAVINGHKQAQRSFALLPAERLLIETDAPFQPVRGKNFSHLEDLPLIINATAALRNDAAGVKASAVTDAKEMETQIEANFRAAFF
ncbi:MAG: TatD family hydrolase [Treponema sp.]|jgi:TatD DNase family protein|nr:TatD family hydrolase [Treponema sp.]